jgi:hypothetical protein
MSNINDLCYIQKHRCPLFDARRRRLRRRFGGTPFVPTGSGRHGAEGGSKAPRSSRGGTGATRSPSFTGEHGEEPPFEATEHRGTVVLDSITNCMYIV